MRMLFIGLALLAMPALAHGAAGEAHLDHVHVDLGDKASLQRGARIFVNFCLSCHSASYMRYTRMAEDLEISEDVVRENLMFATDKIGELMTTTMPKDDARDWFGVAPPDLSLVARFRGADWVYTYLRSFYLDESSPSGWNNIVFPNVAMPHAMYEWQGVQQAVFVEEDGHRTFDRFELVKPARLSPEEFDGAMRDLTNFLVYLGEPAKLKRYTIGFWVIVFLIVLAALTYALKKEYWRDVH